MKRITQIDPSARTTVDVADRYYETVHSAFARDAFLREAPAMTRYGWNRVRGEYDLGGGFRQSPSAWRFVISEWVEPADPATTPRVPAAVMDRLVGDHVNFMREMRPYDVRETTLFDARSGQLSLAKFVFTIAEPIADERLHRFAELLGNAPGARLGLVNQVIRQAETLPLVEPGQRYGDAFLARPALSHILELYFDNRDAGAEFFAGRAVRGLLPAEDGIRGYAVDEWLAFDRR